MIIRKPVLISLTIVRFAVHGFVLASTTTLWLLWFISQEKIWHFTPEWIAWPLVLQVVVGLWVFYSMLKLCLYVVAREWSRDTCK